MLGSLLILVSCNRTCVRNDSRFDILLLSSAFRLQPIYNNYYSSFESSMNFTWLTIPFVSNPLIGSELRIVQVHVCRGGTLYMEVGTPGPPTSQSPPFFLAK
jgi:hypothetical protein